MAEPFLGEIRMFGFNFAPKDWAPCDGRLLAISDNAALFSLLGTTYGGDGRTTFGLPDMRGRAPISMGNGPGLTPRQLGMKSGNETVTLTTAQMPAHNHPLACSKDVGTKGTPVNNFLADVNKPAYIDSSNATMNPEIIENTGGSQAHNNMQPYLALNFCIALEGIYPSRT